MPGAGELRERVTFQQRGEDANGDRLGDWEAGFTVSARVRALRGSEPVLQSRLQGVQPYSVTIRDSTAARQITTAWRAVWGGRHLNIRAIAPDERGAFIDLMMEYGQASS